MLRPGEALDDAATGAWYIREEMHEDDAGVDGKESHHYQRSIEAQQSRTFENKTNGDGHLRTRYHPNQEGRPGFGQGLVVHFPVECFEVKEFT
jgi:hypothetical protein